MPGLLRLNEEEYKLLRILANVPLGNVVIHSVRGRPTVPLQINGEIVCNDAFNYLVLNKCICVSMWRECHITLTGLRTYLANARDDDAIKLWEMIKNDKLN